MMSKKGGVTQRYVPFYIDKSAIFDSFNMRKYINKFSFMLMHNIKIDLNYA